MTKFRSRQIIPLITALLAVLFFCIGVTQLGFWDIYNGPLPGFFPIIISIVMFLASIAAFFQTMKEGEKTVYGKPELMVIAGGAGIIAVSFLIGLIPSCILYIVLWLKLFEKTSWKMTIIVTAVITAIIVGVFAAWLGVQFPMGIFEAWM